MSLPKPAGVHASRLVEKTRALLESEPRTIEKIAELSGVSYHWIQSFKYDKNGAYDVSRVEALYTFLAGSPLKC